MKRRDWRFMIIVTYPLLDRLVAVPGTGRLTWKEFDYPAMDQKVASLIGRKSIGESMGFGRRQLVYGFVTRPAANAALQRCRKLPHLETGIWKYDIWEDRHGRA